MNGGTRDGFDDLTPDDIQAMYISLVARDKILIKDLLTGIGRMFSGGD